MYRLIDKDLVEWKASGNRKPLIIRGARQVGKTHAVDQLGATFEHYVKINLEEQPEFSETFTGNLDPKLMLEEINLRLEEKIVPGKSLLFIDEIQTCPRAIIALRYFYEEMPDLHVIAAGSLIDFAIKKVGVPVGRVSFMYMYPMSFIEFLIAQDNTMAAKRIMTYEIHEPQSNYIHQLFIQYLGEYMAVGGMPEVVKHWRDTRDLFECHKILEDIKNSYKNDFSKYAKDTQLKYVELLFNRIPTTLGRKFKYAHVSDEYRTRELAPCLDLLEHAGVVHRVSVSQGRGVPLGAQASLKDFKLIFLDIGLAQRILGLTPKEFILNPDEHLVNKGSIAEAFVGQELLAYANSRYEPRLYYWTKYAQGQTKEIDYLFQSDQFVIPIEVKSGKGTSLKSVRDFVDTHQDSPYIVRFSTHNYSVHDNLYSYPLYAVSKFMKLSERVQLENTNK